MEDYAVPHHLFVRTGFPAFSFTPSWDGHKRRHPFKPSQQPTHQNLGSKRISCNIENEWYTKRSEE